MIKLLFVLLLSSFGAMQGAAALIGSAIVMDNRDLVAQLLAATGLTIETRAYENALKKWPTITQDVQRERKRMSESLGLEGGGASQKAELPKAVQAEVSKKTEAGNKAAYVALLTTKDEAGYKALIALGRDAKQIGAFKVAVEGALK